MSKNNAPDTKTAEQSTASLAASYTLDELTASAKKAFGVQPEVIVGALRFKYKCDKRKFTKAEVKAAIKSFRAKEVK